MQLTRWTSSLLACLILVACDQTDLLSPGALRTDAAGNADQGSSFLDTNGDPTDGQSVGDVTLENFQDGNEPPATLPTVGSIRARIRNEASVRADVTLRFVRENTIVHLAFVRVLPGTVTTVVSPKAAGLVEVSGIDETGRALGFATFVFGVDFDESRPAQYTIFDPSAEPSDPLPVDPVPADPIVANPDPPTISLLEPSRDVEVVVGATFSARWVDTSDTAGAVVRIALRQVGSTDGAPLIPVGPAVGAALDGINDELVVVLQDIDPGLYEVVAEIDDGVSVVASVAPGLVEAVEDPDNVAPMLSILSPSRLTEVGNGEFLTIEWDDEDPDDNATITFSLVPTDTADASAGAFVISPPLAENPDGALLDRAVLPISGVLPGLYDLIGTISDGELVGTARAVGLIRIRPEPLNDPPRIVFLEPFEEVNVEVGGSFLVAWEDSDSNDDARISILLDPDLGLVELTGNEILLAAALGEDPDGLGDRITLGIPDTVPPGGYRVVGLITDGLTQVVAQAPGLVFVSSVKESDGGDDPELDPQVVLLKPSEDVAVRLGGVVPFKIRLTDMPADATVRLLLIGESVDGTSLRVDVTPPDDPTGDPEEVVEPDELRIPASADVIPNTWWPRRFTLTAEVEADGITYTGSAPGSIWIRQEVEVRSVAMINYQCSSEQTASVLDDPFLGIEIKWFGGGFVQDPGELPAALQVLGVLAPVRFWVSGDQLLPSDGTDDATHRMVFEALESPNAVQVSRVDYATLLGFAPNADLTDPPLPVEPELESGSYNLLTVSDTDLFGPVVSEPAGDLVEICFPLPSSPTSPQP